MMKIPTMFVRDWDGDRSRVLPEVTPGCEWVQQGEGVATRKYDGTACMMRGGVMWKRNEVREGKEPPVSMIDQVFDPETGKTIGWIPVTDGPEDQWHREAYENWLESYGHPPDGTYELLGPKVQKNKEEMSGHRLIPHKEAMPMTDLPGRSFEEIRDYFLYLELNHLLVEGIVFHHPDGRMAKIKARDFGMKR